jgi:hypothetical protein
MSIDHTPNAQFRAVLKANLVARRLYAVTTATLSTPLHRMGILGGAIVLFSLALRCF